MKQITTRDFAQIALVAAIYVVLTITPPLNALSFGVYQLRLSEMMNFTAFYHPKYIIGVTIGCMIANFFSFGLIDVVVGTASTFIFLNIGVILFRKCLGEYLFSGLINKAFFYFAIFFSISMITIAIELHFIVGAPFFLTWFITATGEFFSLLLGGVVMDRLQQRLQLFK